VCTIECSLEGVAGLLRFTGSVSAFAYLGQKESVSEAISDLKVFIKHASIFLIYPYHRA
jgi:hypothetical protein